MLAGVMVAAGLLAFQAAAAPRHAITEIAYLGIDGREIRVVEPDGRLDRVLVRAQRGEHLMAPTWSPDGSLLAFVSTRPGQTIAVWTLRPGEQRRLVFLGRGKPSWSGSLAWSASSDRLAFVARFAESALVYVADLTGGRARLVRTYDEQGPCGLSWLRSGRLVPVECDGRGPVSSPDGSRTVLVRDDNYGNGQLWLVDARGRRVKLTNDVPRDLETHFDYCCAAWSPDGRSIAFLGNLREPYRYDMFVMNADGSGRRRLARSARPINAGPGALSFSRDSRFVSYSRGRLYAVPLAGGPEYVVTRRKSFSWSWNGRTNKHGSSFRFRTTDAPRRTVRVLRATLDYWAGRVLATRRLPLPLGVRPVAASPQADVISVLLPGGATYGRRFGVVDVPTGRLRIVAWGAGPRWWPAGGEFSSDGSKLLIRRWRRLVAVDIRTGRAAFVAFDQGPGPFGWLNDGRVAFIDRRGRFRAVRIGGRPKSLGFTLPRDAAPDVTWSPNGRYVLYARRCAVHLLDLQAGTTGSLGSRVDGFDPAPGPWAPDSKHVLLPRGFWENHCRRLWRYPQTAATIHDVALRRVGEVSGWDFTWSPDGRVVVSTGGTTGSSVALLQGAGVFSLHRRVAATIFPNRVSGPAFLTANGWLVHERYLAAADDRTLEKYAAAPTYASLLIARWRR
jgi:dipeptidyl aminopeptidase/acylaminoacyl peptidase